MTVSRQKTVLYFSPHQDDEILSMGIAICNSVRNGQNVHVVLCTDGSKCKVRIQMSDGKACFVCTGCQGSIPDIFRLYKLVR